MTPRREAFRRALDRLRDVLREDETAITRDAAIQRFEFCFELGWKTIQEAARVQGVDCASPRACGRVGFRLGWIHDEAGWLAMLEDRNLTAHTYNEELAREVYGRLPAHLALLEATTTALPAEDT
ncbi:MAG: HI0074 family nucleotidyltransferase substrate-binding subunit [Gemmatimonadota bacterium]